MWCIWITYILLRFLSSISNLLFIRKILVVFCGVSTVTFRVSQPLRVSWGEQRQYLGFPFSLNGCHLKEAYVPSKDCTGSQRAFLDIWGSGICLHNSAFNPWSNCEVFVYCIKIKFGGGVCITLRLRFFFFAFNITWCGNISSKHCNIMDIISC